MFRVLKEVSRKSITFTYITLNQDLRTITIDINKK